MQISNMAFHFVIGTRYNHFDELDTRRALPLVSDVSRYFIIGGGKLYIHSQLIAP